MIVNLQEFGLCRIRADERIKRFEQLLSGLPGWINMAVRNHTIEQRPEHRLGEFAHHTG